MIKSLLYFSFLFISFNGSAVDTAENVLKVEKEGSVVMVVDFQEGDKIKLFEVSTGDHVLSKTHGEIDLSQLPLGSYLLENNEGESIVIDYLEDGVFIEGAEEMIKEDFVLSHDSERTYSKVVSNEEEYINYYDENYRTEILEIEREGDLIKVIDFKEGDKIKLFEVKNTVHVLTKTTEIVDLSQLGEGAYLLENNRGQSVVIEKFAESNFAATE